MTQNNYNLILDCIKYGAPAVQNELTNEFNNVVSNHYKYLDAINKAQRDQAAAERDQKVKNDMKQSTTKKAAPKKVTKNG